jgi:hypothetical protein
LGFKRKKIKNKNKLTEISEALTKISDRQVIPVVVASPEILPLEL